MTDSICIATSVRKTDPGNALPQHCTRPRARARAGSGAAVDVEVATLRHRLKELESENIALRTRVNRLIMSLSKTLLRDAAN